MKKVLFLLLFPLVLGVAGTNAQVRIGGDGEPNEAAVLDLNADDATDDGTKGLALPRVSLDSDDAILAGTSNLLGMLVYNTGGSLSAGVYFWNGSNWIMGLTDTIPGGGLDKTVDGEVGIKTGGVTSSMILDGTIASADIAESAVTLNKTSLTRHLINVSGLSGTVGASIVFPLPTGCDGNKAWVSANTHNHVLCYMTSDLKNVAAIRVYANSGPAANCALWCFD